MVNRFGKRIAVIVDKINRLREEFTKQNLTRHSVEGFAKMHKPYNTNFYSESIVSTSRNKV